MLMDRLFNNNSRHRVFLRLKQGHLRQRQQIRLVLPRHPRPPPVPPHQLQDSEDTPLSRSAQRARKPPNHEWCQTASVPVAHSRKSRPARQTGLTRSREVGAALDRPPSLVCHRRVPPLQSPATNGRRTKRRKLHPHHPQSRLLAASRNPRSAEQLQRCSGLTVNRSSSRTVWLSNGFAIHQTPRRGTVSRILRRISAPTSRKGNLPR